MKNRPAWRYLVVATVVLLVVAGLVLQQQWRSQKTRPATLTLGCADLVAGCTTHTPQGALSLGVSEMIQPLLPFEIWLKPPAGYPLARAEAHFSMVGMDMGFNLYTLRPDAGGVYRVTATLPFCISGRADWVLTLELHSPASLSGAAVPLRLDVPFATAALR